MLRYKDFAAEGYHTWKLIKHTKEAAEYMVLQPSYDRGDECSLIYLTKGKTGEMIALKSYPKAWAHNYPGFVENEEAILKSLKGVCKGVPQLIGEGGFVFEDKKCLTMELCNQGSLYNTLRETGPLSEAELKDVVTSVLETLSVLHSRKIIHRNINSKHILVHYTKEKGITYKLCDFKFAFICKDKLPKEWVGTPTFMAPEISYQEKTEYNQAVDIWSLGMTCYHLIMGRTPQSIDNNFFKTIIGGEKIKFEKRALEGVSPVVIDFISACLTLDPAKRPTVDVLQKHPFLHAPKLNSNAIISTIMEEEAEQLAQLFVKLWSEKIKYKTLTHKTSLEPYERIKELGNGQFGPIWHTKDKKTGVEYITKILRRGKLMDEKAILAMIEELRILHALEKSPYVINIREAFIFKGDFYLVLEFCNGGDLEGYIQTAIAEMPLPPTELKQIAWNVISGLKEINGHGRVHGELKPKNVLIVKDDSNRLVDVKLCDLGLSQEVELLCGSTTMAGAIDFHSPEKKKAVEAFRSGSHYSIPLTEKADVFSFGAILYFVTYGKSPYKPGMKDDIVLEFESPTYKSKLPVEINKLMKRCLSIKPEDRPTIAEVIADKFFEMPVEIPYRTSIAPYIYTDYIVKEGKLGITVMEAKRIGSAKELAVKKIDLKGKMSKEFLKRFTKEIDVLLKVNMIPTVIKIHDAFYCKESINIIMDYCNGGDLETYVLSQGKLNKEISLEEKNFIAYCVMHGIHSIHGKHHIHKDINPRNILLERDIVSLKLVRARIGDFGVNRILVEGPIEEEKRAITTCYLAPEIASGKADYKTDIWSFGMLLYFLFLGKHAHEQYKIEDILSGKMLSEIPTVHKAEIPSSILGLLLKCLALNPSERPTTSEILAHPVFYPFEGTFAH